MVRFMRQLLVEKATKVVEEMMRSLRSKLVADNPGEDF